MMNNFNILRTRDQWVRNHWFFKLGLVLLSLSLVACGQKNNSEDNNHEDMHQDTQLNIEQYTQEESTEDEYYTIIKEAWQKQKDYIKSIEDSKVKQSVQTSRSAAIMEANRLLIEHQEDSDAINSSLKRVLNDE